MKDRVSATVAESSVLGTRDTIAVIVSSIVAESSSWNIGFVISRSSIVTESLTA